MIHGEVKVWRFDGQVEPRNRDHQGAWSSVHLDELNFVRFVRHASVRALCMNEDFTVMDRDGHWQTGRSGDYVVLDDGYLSVMPRASFEPAHHQITNDRIDMANEIHLVRATMAGVLNEYLDAATPEVLADDDQRLDLAFKMASAMMATVATL